jgi:crotonobetainyl-CoA:carnitine CoA-transferase CaiB-like acyl-CoA transferase
MTQLPLAGVSVLDFSTLLPGPLASLMLAEAGAAVIKVERPEGEDLRRFEPAAGESSAPFMMLNGGKDVIGLDLKIAAHRDHAIALATRADVLIEQFRPGVMERLGLGFVALSALNPKLIYCSITGFGQAGPHAQEAGHDLTYQALSGVLAQSLQRHQPPPLPPALIADMAGGAYPAVLNILLALRQRDTTGMGCHLDIAMTGNMMPFAWLGAATAAANAGSGKAPDGAATLLTGASPRYRIYASADGWFVAVGAIEDKFWHVFCAAIELPEPLRWPQAPASEVIAAVSAIMAAHDAGHWRNLLEPLDCCCCVVRTLDEATADAQARLRQHPARVADGSGVTLPMQALPIVPSFRHPGDRVRQVGRIVTWPEQA